MFYCRYCEDEFTDAKQLKKHEKVCDCNPANASIEKFVCRNCRATFRTKDELAKHMQSCKNIEKDFED